MPGDESPPARPPRITTWCHDCEGRGERFAPRSAHVGGVPGTITVMQRCKTCKGTGKIPGFQPPA
jgi:DnaJ-class molecular chaperone